MQDIFKAKKRINKQHRNNKLLAINSVIDQLLIILKMQKWNGMKAERVIIDHTYRNVKSNIRY